MKTKVVQPVLVLECHHGSLGIARSLGRFGVPVHCVYMKNDDPALLSRYFKGAFFWDFMDSSEESTVAFLLNLGQEIGGSPLLIATSDKTTELIAKNATPLSSRFIFPLQSPDMISKLVSKRENYFLAKECGVPVAETMFPQNVSEVAKFTETANFPVMLKGIDGRRLLHEKGIRMKLVTSADELLTLYKEMENFENPNLMIQEYIPGGDDTIWMFNGYFDKSSECRASFVGRKIRQSPPYIGSTSLGICEKNDLIADITIRFMKAIGYVGILDIGYRYDARDGQYKLLDPNPRIGGTFRLFVGEDDMDVVRFLYLDMTGQKLPQTTPCYGRKWFVEDRDLESCLIYRRDGKLGLLQWLKSFHGVCESAWFAWDDLRPFFFVARSILARGLSLIGRKIVGTKRGSNAFEPDPE